MKKIQFGSITCILGDCEDYMQECIERNMSFDLAHCDPNYGLNAGNYSDKPCMVKQKNGSLLPVLKPAYEKSNWDDSPPGKSYFELLKSISNNQIIWGVNYYEYPLPGGRIVWDKLNNESDQFDCEIAYCSINKRTDLVYYMWSGMFQGLEVSRNIHKALIQQGNKKLNEKRIHACQKPVKLYKWFLTNYAKNGYKILDTHGGSFSHAIACHDLGFELTIIEKDEQIFNNGIKRLKIHQQQQLISFDR